MPSASRIGAVRGDLVAVEVVEHREGRAVDEFVVELADGDHLSLLLSEIAEVDGVALQDVRPVSGRRHDRRLEAYTTALIILQSEPPTASSAPWRHGCAPSSTPRGAPCSTSKGSR